MVLFDLCFHIPRTSQDLVLWSSQAKCSSVQILELHQHSSVMTTLRDSNGNGQGDGNVFGLSRIDLHAAAAFEQEQRLGQTLPETSRSTTKTYVLLLLQTAMRIEMCVGYGSEEWPETQCVRDSFVQLVIINVRINSISWVFLLVDIVLWSLVGHKPEVFSKPGNLKYYVLYIVLECWAFLMIYLHVLIIYWTFTVLAWS